MRRQQAAPVIAALGVALAAAAQEAPRMERVSIEDGSGAARWGPAEATVEQSAEFAGPDGKSLCLHIDVDHTAGEPNYPVGWPRMALKPPPEMQDWSRFDFLELVIHTETSREALPATPLGFIAHTPDKANAYNRTLTELRKGETTTLTIPLSQIPRHNLVPHLQFYISESNYRHGDVLDFYIDDLALTRYAAPTVSDFAPLQSIAFADAATLGARFRLLGVEEGKTAVVQAVLRQGGATVADAEWELLRGEHEAWLSLTTPLKPGGADLELSLGESRQTARVRFVASPYGD
ncbi:MAG: hypothetical protein FJX74_10015 [Armatimonadetes bacterium]|nr:hypothetical protein [Armatimonadota bacterium]